jgi:nucleotide-binding universal stress UspA family protein
MLEQVTSILVPVDFSIPSRVAVETAANIAHRYGAEMYILHVYQDVFSVLSMRTFDLNEDVVHSEIVATVEEQMDEFLGDLKLKVPYHREVRKGQTAEQIVTFAGENETSLIVIATNARSSFEEMFIGSVTHSVVRNAPCPVLTCRPPAR